MMNDLDTLRPKVRDAINRTDMTVEMFDTLVTVNRDNYDTIRAELLRLADENARLNKIESLTTEQRLQMEDVELYLMHVSQPDDGDAPWCDRMKSAIELLVQDCNEAVGQKNKAEAELAALKARIADAPVYEIPLSKPKSEDGWVRVIESVKNERSVRGKRVRLVVED